MCEVNLRDKSVSTEVMKNMTVIIRGTGGVLIKSVFLSEKSLLQVQKSNSYDNEQKYSLYRETN